MQIYVNFGISPLWGKLWRHMREKLQILKSDYLNIRLKDNFSKRNGVKKWNTKNVNQGCIFKNVLKNGHAPQRARRWHCASSDVSHWDLENKKKIKSISLPGATLFKIMWFGPDNFAYYGMADITRSKVKNTKSWIASLMVKISTWSFFCFKGRSEIHHLEVCFSSLLLGGHVHFGKHVQKYTLDLNFSYFTF